MLRDQNAEEEFIRHMILLGANEEQAERLIHCAERWSWVKWPEGWTFGEPPAWATRRERAERRLLS